MLQKIKKSKRMKTKYDWRNIPDWVNFIAIDRDGKKRGFEDKPHIHAGGFWANYRDWETDRKSVV